MGMRYGISAMLGMQLDGVLSFSHTLRTRTPVRVIVGLVLSIKVLGVPSGPYLAGNAPLEQNSAHRVTDHAAQHKDPTIFGQMYVILAQA